MAKPKTPKTENAEQPETIGTDEVVMPEPVQPDAEPVEVEAKDQPKAEDVALAEVEDVAPAMAETEVATPPKSPTPPKNPTPSPKARRGGFFPMLLGGVAAAAIGAGGVIYLLPKLPQGWLPLPEVQQVDEAALRAAIAKNASQAEAMAADLAALKAAPAPQPDLTPLEAALAESAQRVEGVAQTIAALDARLTDLEKRPVAGGGASDSALAAFEREMTDMRALIAQSQDSAAGAKAEIAAAAEEAAARIAGAETEASKLRADAQAAAHRMMAEAALARLAAALDTGAPTDAALADLRAAGLEIPEVLSAPVPSLVALRADFPEVARAALALSRKATAGDTAIDKLGAFLMAQTGARSLEPQQGDGPDAVLSRAEAALGAGDLPQALAEIATLPAEGAAALADWRARAEHRIAATTALAALAQSLK